MNETKSTVFVLYYSMNRCIGAIEDGGRDEPIVDYALTSEQDAALFRQGMDDAAGWMRICSFRSREEAVRHVEECLSRAAAGNRSRNRPWAAQELTAAVRTVTCQRGPHTAGQHQVHVVHGEDDTVKETVEEGGLDAAIHSYPFSSDQDAAEFERALENHDGWWENDTFPTREDAVECLQRYHS